MRNERYDFLYLPKRFQAQHQTCEFLVYQIEDFILKEAYEGLRRQTISFETEPIVHHGEHILSFLKRTGKNDKHDEIITNTLLNGLIADTCQFLQVALFASLQQRLTVAFSLIRKPFVYNLLVILRLYFTTDFHERFNSEEKFDTTDLKKEDIIELLEISEKVLYSKNIKAEEIYRIIFDQSSGDSIVNMSNKALHPSTTRNKANLTEVQNLNFIFSTTESIETQWDYLYRKLPFLLLYLNEVLDFIVFSQLNLDNQIYADRLLERAEYLGRTKSC